MWLRKETATAQNEIDALVAKLRSNKVAPTSKLIEDIYSLIADDLKSADAIAQINKWVTTEGTDGDAAQLRAVIDGLLGIALPA